MTLKTPLSLMNLVPWRSIAHKHARMPFSMMQFSITPTTTPSTRTRSRIQISNMVTVTQTSASNPLPSSKVTSSSSHLNPTMLTNQDNESIIITQSALQQIHHLAKQKRPEEPSQVYLRVYVDAGGCSGFQYKFELEQMDKEEQSIDEDEDVIIHITNNMSNQNGAKEGEDNEKRMEACVVVDNTSLNYLKGSTLDYVREMIRSSFVIANNPQSESACGCGSSFAVKNFASNPALD